MYFDREMELLINTTTCTMTWTRNHYKGAEEIRTFDLLTEQNQQIHGRYKVCKIEFTSSIFIGKKVRVKIGGNRALSLVSTHGSIEINSPLNISGSAMYTGISNTSIGGYGKTSDDGVDGGRHTPSGSLETLYTSGAISPREIGAGA